MHKQKLTNLIFGGNSALTNYPPLVCRHNAGRFVQFDDEPDMCKLEGKSTFDFLTYFNSVSTFKWKEYTGLDNVHVTFEHKGSAAKFIPANGNSFDYETQFDEDSAIEIPASDDWTTFDVELEIREHHILNGFGIALDGELEIRNGFYYTEVDESRLHEVEIAIATTTFKKEDYVTKNIALLEGLMANEAEEASSHIHLYVIDNGRTLPKDVVTHEHSKLVPNPNVGGSGGFAKGMIEALEQDDPKATHVLLMDDDVMVMTESFIRCYNLLRLVKDDYIDAFIAGAMFSMQEQDLRTEDIGYFTNNGNFRPWKSVASVCKVGDAIKSETWCAPGSEGDSGNHYAGWWYCAIPLSVVKKVGLPLPVFVRADDAEYSLRANAKLMAMNGICIWHDAFFYKYSAAVERYQVSRNTLVAQATTGVAQNVDFLHEIKDEVRLDLKKFNYDDAELAVKGFEDFLKGPAYIENPTTEKDFMYANKAKEKMIPLEEINEEAKKLGVDLFKMSADQIWYSEGRNMSQRATDFVTFNGQRTVFAQKRKAGSVEVIDAVGWCYPAGKIRRAETLIVVDVPNKKGCIRHLNKERFNAIWNRYKAAEKQYKKNKKEIYEQYAARREEFTSVEFWKNYIQKAWDALENKN